MLNSVYFACRLREKKNICRLMHILGDTKGKKKLFESNADEEKAMSTIFSGFQKLSTLY